MEEAIRNFKKQFEWEPKIENKESLRLAALAQGKTNFTKFVLCGMGGSHLQGDIMQAAYPGFDLSVHQDYGISAWPDEALKQTLIIASSYSGNTEETLSAYEEAQDKGYSVAVSTKGGKLLEMAKADGVPYVQLPDNDVQPRAALGYTFKALAKLAGKEDALKEASQLASMLDNAKAEKAGREIAKHLQGKVPIVYASNRNYAVAYNWKIKFNESGKIPAFYNVFPELNHNEMNGFDGEGKTKELGEPFFFVFLQDSKDHPRIQKRMEVLQKQLHDRGFPVILIDLEGNTRLERIFSSLLVADWTALLLAEHYGQDPEQVPMIEEFKKLIG